MLTNPLSRLKSNFKGHFNKFPAMWASAPGRINLIGEHTDYSEGFVLPAAIDRFISIAFSPRNDNLLVLYSIDFQDHLEINLSEDFSKTRSWKDYVLGTVWALREYGYKLTGFNGAFSGNIPIGAGLSSSAALQIAVIKAIALASKVDLSLSEIAKICQKGEVDWVGVDVGIMDQLISAAGKASQAFLIDCRSLNFEYVKIPDDIVFVVLDTNTRRELTKSEYNLRHAEVNQAAKILGVPYLRDASLDDLIAKKKEMPDILFQRAKHVITENLRVHKFAAAMQRDDFDQMGAILIASHESLQTDFEVSSEELNLIVNLAQQQTDCLGARMMGAGFGGCALAMLKTNQVEAFSEIVSGAYYQRTRIRPNIFKVTITDGVVWGDYIN